MKTKTVDGVLFAKMIQGGAASLSAHRKTVNDLNVFPIPDGDTGDNMFMTIDSGAAALYHHTDVCLGNTASAVAKGMLLGARGNSGVILSRIFAGISKKLEGAETADAVLLGKAFEAGISEAYSAVSVPVEGTILTVYKDAVQYTIPRITADSDIESCFDNFVSEMRRSLQKTPELLEVLRQAGVVDSGGAGLVYIAEGMRNALMGEDFDEHLSTPQTLKTVDFEAFDENSVLTFGYCTEFFLRLQNEKIKTAPFDLEKFRQYLSEAGESVVAFQEGTIVKVHVHTMHPGDILNYCQQYGEFLTTKIENMSLQHNEVIVHEDYEPAKVCPHKTYGIVSVATGKGIRDVFTSLGCDVVVDGGQSMNPSAEELLYAFSQINADNILIYPNNSNIILTAQQAASLYRKAKVFIIPTKTIGEGYAAISLLDTDKNSAEEILEEQTSVIEGVVTGIVAQAVRDTEQSGMSIHKGDYIGFVDDDIYDAAENKNTVLINLSNKLHMENYDIALLICGESVTAQESESAHRLLREKYPNTEIYMIDGQQPIYDYILTLE